MTDKTPLVTTSRDALAKALFGINEPLDESWDDRFDPSQREVYLSMADALLASGVVRAVDGLAEDEALMRRVAVAEYGELLSEAAQIAGARLVQPHVRALAKVLADG